MASTCATPSAAGFSTTTLAPACSARIAAGASWSCVTADHHDVQVELEQLVERDAHRGVVRLRQRSGGAGVGVEARDEAVRAERFGPLGADEPAADDADA